MEVTSLALTVGVPQHVTVVDHNNADTPLLPASITWVAFGGANVSMIASDSTGFNFLANSPMTGSFQATFHSGSVSIPGPSLSVTAVASVQPAYTSP